MPDDDQNRTTEYPSGTVRFQQVSQNRNWKKGSHGHLNVSSFSQFA